MVAPYATALALMVDPAAAIPNLRRLEKCGATGIMGFYDAIDYTPPQRGGKPGVVIYTYMVHHQAMTLLALSNTIDKRAVQRRFHSDPRIRAVESLLCKRIPITRVEAEEVSRPPRAVSNWRQIPAQDRELLFAAARVVLGSHRGPLQQQLLRLSDVTLVMLLHAHDWTEAPMPRSGTRE